jgi:dihydrofolate reductase
VTDGIEDALARARDAAGGLDVRLGGGVATIRQYLSARLIDHLHVAVSPILLGSGEALLAGVDLPRLGYEVSEHVFSDNAMHVVLSKPRRGGFSSEDR